MIYRLLVIIFLAASVARADPGAQFVQTPYEEPKVVFDEKTKTYLQKMAFETAQEFERLAKAK